MHNKIVNTCAKNNFITFKINTNRYMFMKFSIMYVKLYEVQNNKLKTWKSTERRAYFNKVSNYLTSSKILIIFYC